MSEQRPKDEVVAAQFRCVGMLEAAHETLRHAFDRAPDVRTREMIGAAIALANKAVLAAWEAK